MNLRLKTLALVLATFVLSAATLFYFASSISLNSYRAIEHESAVRDLERLDKVVLAELRRMFMVLEDFASWDDTYDFIESGDEDYVLSNFTEDTFSLSGIEFVVITDDWGSPVHTSVHGPPGPDSTAALGELAGLLSDDGDLFEEVPEEFGLLDIDGKIMAVAMAPVRRSDDAGSFRGLMVFGRMLGPEALNEIRSHTQLDFSLYNSLSLDLSEDVSATIDTLLDQPDASTYSLTDPLKQVVPVSEELLKGYMLLPDILGDPLAFWSVSIPREIYAQGKKSLTFLLVAMAIIGAALITAVVLLLEMLVLKRVTRLGGEVADIGRQDDLSVRVTAKGADELGQLGKTVNWMLEQLQISQRRAKEEHERAEALLLNILPGPIAEQLKATSESIAEAHQDVSVLFADLAGFTPLSATMSPVDLVSMLNDVFSRYDELSQSLGLEKIKTIGDAYMVAAGLPMPREDHAEALADMALGMIAATEDYSKKANVDLQIRIGINSGTVVAGVIGKKKFIYDLWGDTVNIASRMESSGEVGRVQVTEATYEHLKASFDLEPRGTKEVKGRGKMSTYLLIGRKSGPTFNSGSARES